MTDPVRTFFLYWLGGKWKVVIDDGWWWLEFPTCGRSCASWSGGELQRKLFFFSMEKTHAQRELMGGLGDGHSQD